MRMLRSMDSRAERPDELLRNMRMFKALVRASLSRLLDVAIAQVVSLAVYTHFHEDAAKVQRLVLEANE